MRLFIWLGGAIFAVALAVTGWTYVVVFAADLPYQGGTAVLIDTLLFSCFALHHTVTAREAIKTRIAALIPAALVRSLYVWIASLLLLAVDLLWQPIGGHLYRVPWPMAALFLLVQLAGVWWTVRGTRAIDPLELAGIRERAAATDLQVDGPYGVVRHPLYLGWLLMVWGTAEMTGDRLAFAAVSTAYLVVAIPFEERSLVRLFGARYQHYRERVRWRMLPFIY